MSTYNPNLSYLKEQIDSLLCQDIGIDKYDIIIRDDGSSDDEVLSYLKLLPDNHSNVSVFFGDNIGVFGSFWALIEDAYKRGYNYISLSDQDDIALPHKLSSAIKILQNEDQSLPLLFFSQMTYVNEHLEKQGVPFMNQKVLGFKNALFESSINGNLMVINRKACKIAVSKKPHAFYMHDWWIYLCVSAFGKVLFSSDSTLLYRQHSNNVIGGSQSFLDVMKRRLKRFSEYSDRTYPVFKQGKEFYDLFGTLLNDNKKRLLLELINSKRSFLNRIKYSLSRGNFIRMTTFDNVLVRILILANKY